MPPIDNYVHCHAKLIHLSALKWKIVIYKHFTIVWRYWRWCMNKWYLGSISQPQGCAPVLWWQKESITTREGKDEFLTKWWKVRAEQIPKKASFWTEISYIIYAKEGGNTFFKLSLALGSLSLLTGSDLEELFYKFCRTIINLSWEDIRKDHGEGGRTILLSIKKSQRLVQVLVGRSCRKCSLSEEVNQMDNEH